VFFQFVLLPILFPFTIHFMLIIFPAVYRLCTPFHYDFFDILTAHVNLAADILLFYIVINALLAVMIGCSF